MLSNLAKLWIPLEKSFVVSGIKVNGNIIRSEPALTLATGAAWQPTFDRKPFNQESAASFLSEVGNIGDWGIPTHCTPKYLGLLAHHELPWGHTSWK